MGTAPTIRETERNLGIDLLRLVSMLMVICLHCLGWGGLSNALEGTPAAQQAAWFLGAACYGAVNLYALTTGYVYAKAQRRRSKIVTLWQEVFFYSVLLTAIGIAVNGTIEKETLLQTLFPTTLKRWWYFSSYFLLFFLIPFLNRLISGFSKRRYRLVLLLGFLLLCGINWGASRFERDSFMANGGYSPLWLAYLYLVGAYIRIYAADFTAVKKRVLLGVYALCTLLTWCSKLLLGGLTKLVFGRALLDDALYSYLSPTVVIGSIALLIFFTKIKISHGKRFLCAIAPCSFGVYLIHTHPFVWENLLKQYFRQFAQTPWYLQYGRMIVVAIALFVGCLAIDYLRGLLFRALRLPRLSEWITEKAERIVERVIKE